MLYQLKNIINCEAKYGKENIQILVMIDEKSKNLSIYY